MTQQFWTKGRKIATGVGLGLTALAAGAYFYLHHGKFSVNKEERFDACDTTFSAHYTGNLDNGSVYVQSINDHAGEFADFYLNRVDGKWKLDKKKTLDANVALWKEKWKNESKLRLGYEVAKMTLAIDSYGTCVSEIAGKLKQ